jgi:peroxiredoxin
MARHSTMLALGTSAPRFALPDTHAKTRTLEEFAASSGLLVAFICNHCPYVQHILEGFVQFAREYAPKGLAVLAISSNDVESYPQDAPAAMARLAKNCDFGFPYLFDETQAVATAYQAVCTPDFFLFDRKRRLAYRGQFDGSRPGNNTPVSGADMRVAAEAVLSGRPVPALQLASTGCGIKWKPGNAPDEA